MGEGGLEWVASNCAPIPAGKINIDTILDERARELYFEEPPKLS
jgi:starch-binding outer membrane protein, SusD/RagB family